MRIVGCSVSKITEEDKKLSSEQKPVLEKLESMGYGIYIEDDFYMAMPLCLRENNFPLDLYNIKMDKKITVENWEELVKLSIAEISD